MTVARVQRPVSDSLHRRVIQVVRGLVQVDLRAATSRHQRSAAEDWQRSREDRRGVALRLRAEKRSC